MMNNNQFKNFDNNFILNNKRVSFNLKNYLKDSLDIPREQMPQINYDDFFEYLDVFKKHIHINKIRIPANLLKPIQNEINLDKVVNNIIKKEQSETTDEKDPIFITSDDFHIIDGHHTHVEILMTEPTKLVDVYVFDFDAIRLYNFFTGLKSFLREYKTIKDESVMEELDYIKFGLNYIISENYGMQGQEAVVGMGEVNFGIPQTANGGGENGSGDVIITKNGNIFKSKALLKTQDVGRFMTEDDLREIARKYQESKTNESMSIPDKDIKEKNKIIEKNHYPKDLPNDLLNEFKLCHNKVVLKKYMEIPEEFSCETMEGVVQGKAGDILMVGVNGEIYPIDKDVFEQTYQRL